MTATSVPGPPIVFVLFGATGDLAKRMVIPAFFTLAQQKLLPDNYLLIGNGRGDVSHEEFRGHVHEVLHRVRAAPGRRAVGRLQLPGCVSPAAVSSTDDPGSLLDVIADASAELGEEAQLVHYLAVPPVAFIGLTAALGKHDLAADSRVVYEKPFGTSPENFRELDKAVHEVLDESQVYRIDHFLGKEATQDLHVLRFANSLFATAWNAEHIKSVQIDAPETLDIDDRAVFYDATGAMLDMLITHLFQVAAEVAMEPPASMGADDLQSAREEVIGCFRPLDPAEVVLGQYEGYRDVPGHRARLDHRHLRRRPDVGGQRSLARGAVPDADRQTDGRRRPSGSASCSANRRTPRSTCPPGRRGADAVAGRQRRGAAVDGRQGTGRRA